MILRPMKGRRVLDPAQTPPSPLPPEGRRVVDSPYWRSKLKEGVVARADTLDQGIALDPNPTTPEPAPELEAEAGKTSQNKGVQGSTTPGKK